MRKNRILRLLSGMAMLPMCVAATLTVLEALNYANRSSSMFSRETTALFSGYAAWLRVWFFLPRPAKSYILAHELTHAISGLLFGAKISKFNVSSHGGSVSLSKTNLWIILSPYFIPFYTIILIAAYLITATFLSPVPWKPLWIFLIGFTWSFHACFTLNSLMIRQPDIQMYGRIFSYVIIYLLNLVLVALWIIFITPVNAEDFYQSFWRHTTSIYMLVYQQTAWAVHKAAGLIKELRNSFAA